MSGMLPWGKHQFCDGNGNPLVGGWVAYCQIGTGGQIFRNVYGDSAETVVLENPVPLDASGRPYSGGSQQSLWGDGSYEEFVYDRNGVLQTSSIITAPLDDLSGNLTVDGTLTVNGATTLNGPLTVNGNETDNGNLSAQNGNFGGLGVSGNASIGGNENVGGALTAGDISTGNINASTGTIDNLDVPGTLNVGTVNANIVNANQINAPGQGGTLITQIGSGVWSHLQGGLGGGPGGFYDDGTYSMNNNFPTPFPNNCLMIIFQGVPAPAPDNSAQLFSTDYGGWTIPGYLSRTGFSAYLGPGYLFPNQPTATFNYIYVAFGN